MARIFFVFLALMCLSACGGGRTEDGAPPQEIPLEQDYNPSEQDVQTLEEEEAPSGLEASEAERRRRLRKRVWSCAPEQKEIRMKR